MQYNNFHINKSHYRHQDNKLKATVYHHLRSYTALCAFDIRSHATLNLLITTTIQDIYTEQKIKFPEINCTLNYDISL